MLLIQVFNILLIITRVKKDHFLILPNSRGEKGIVADAGIVADNDISRTIIVIKKLYIRKM